MFAIPTANSLVTYLKDFTGSTNDAEIKQCIFNNELAMRNIELPALRSDPYSTTGVVGNNQLMPIPSDMNKPILFFMQGPTGSSSTITATCTGAAGVNLITITVSASQPLQVGMSVSGTGIGAGAIISYFASDTQIVLSVNNTGTVNGILTFGATEGTVHGTGPWIVFDRIGDRDIISQSLLAWNYLSPANVPAVIRGKFSEVGQNYQFLPLIGAGSIINLYYYKAWDLLFTPTADSTLISATGTIATVSGTSPWAVTITGMTTSAGLSIGDTVTVESGTGSASNNTLTVTGITSSTSISVSASGTTIAPITGTVTNVTRTTAGTVQTNPVLQTWPEGYVYGSLHEYYVKRRSQDDAAMYKQKFIDAWKTVEDQNSLGKWSGGHTRLTSIFQPRRAQQYSVK
jgi:hypothetical protein